MMDLDADYKIENEINSIVNASIAVSRIPLRMSTQTSSGQIAACFARPFSKLACSWFPGHHPENRAWLYSSSSIEYVSSQLSLLRVYLQQPSRSDTSLRRLCLPSSRLPRSQHAPPSSSTRQREAHVIHVCHGRAGPGKGSYRTQKCLLASSILILTSPASIL